MSVGKGSLAITTDWWPYRNQLWQVQSLLDSLCKILKTNTNSILFFFHFQFRDSVFHEKYQTEYQMDYSECIRFGWLPSIIQIDPLRNFINLDRQLYRWENVFDQLKTKRGSTMYVWKINISLMLKCLEISFLNYVFQQKYPSIHDLEKLELRPWSLLEAAIFLERDLYYFLAL